MCPDVSGTDCKCQKKRKSKQENESVSWMG